MILTRVLAFPNQQKLTRGQTRNSGKALLGSLLQQRRVGTSNRFPFLLISSERGVIWFLICGEGKCVSRGLFREIP